MFTEYGWNSVYWICMQFIMFHYCEAKILPWKISEISYQKVSGEEKSLLKKYFIKNWIKSKVKKNWIEFLFEIVKIFEISVKISKKNVFWKLDSQTYEKVSFEHYLGDESVT